MQYIKETKKSVEQAEIDLKEAVARHNFGVLHVYDLKETLKNKGFDLPAECRILEVCNPQQAIRVLSSDMSMNMALPCRISVYQDHAGGTTKIGMIRPSAMLQMLSQSEELKNVAEEVEEQIIKMIDEAV